MAKKIPLRVYSAQGLKGRIVQSGMSEVTLYKYSPKEKVEIGKEMSPTYSFIDIFRREYSLHHCDVEVIIDSPITLNSLDGTFLEGKGLKGLLINGFGEMEIQLEDKEHRYVEPNFCRFPNEGLEVEIMDIDAYVWEYEGGIYLIDYSPATLGCAEIIPNRFECTVKWSEEDKCFLAYSCVSPYMKTHGPTREDARNEFYEMI